ncbi:hypothetical protein [Saccharopolyspora sp. CA-218241]|uniref:hypothetical protein n=1 Tax=Saccharopolyspora sp. CA-218241 TaxID=3240027 RepID=UPI003D97C7A7
MTGAGRSPRAERPARVPRRLTLRGDLADALADEPTRVLPRVPAPRYELVEVGCSRDAVVLRRVLDGLRRL